MLAPTLLGLLALPRVMAQTIQITCEVRDRPFCGEYQLSDDVQHSETTFEMTKDDRDFLIKKKGSSDEYCISLRKGLQLCGKPESDVIIKVKNGKESEQTGYSMVFDLENCDDDLYGDCAADSELKVDKEISGGVVASVNALPFMLRLHIQGSRGTQGRCGASLIHPKFFIGALHCFNSEGFDFLKNCFRRGALNGRCYAVIREHYVDSADDGEVKINILRIFEPPGPSDLVIGELERAVALDSKAQVITVSPEPLRPGDLVTTAGWGLFGPTGHLSNVLRRTELEVSKGGNGNIIRTKVGLSSKGVPIDTCEGDSGGPLIKWSDSQDAFVLHATLYGGGYNCRKRQPNTTYEDGRWNSVLPYFQWIKSVINGWYL